MGTPNSGKEFRYAGRTFDTSQAKKITYSVWMFIFHYAFDGTSTEWTIPSGEVPPDIAEVLMASGRKIA